MSHLLLILSFEEETQMGNSDTTYSAGTSVTVPDIATLGQVFTPDWVVERSAVGIEIDERIKCPQRSSEEAAVSVS